MIIATVFMSLCLCGCSYSVYMNAYPHLKTIQIAPFENQTSEYQLAQDIQNYLVDKYQGDGRLRIATMSPDARIEGSVLDYQETIYGYDIEKSVTEYRVQMLLSITMTDMIYSQTLYENKSLLMNETYSPTGDKDNPLIYTTPEQAQEKIYEKVFDTLMRETLESW